MNEILFLVINDDDHADPDYHLRCDKQEALNLARWFADQAKEYYRDMASYINPCDGSNGWWFNESGEERWHVSVREVKLQ